MIKLIHPKTETVREVAESNQNKLNILKRAGFVPFDSYRPKKKPVVVPDPSVSEVVEKHKVEGVDPADAPKAETAVHVSPPARKLILDNDLNPAFIEATGRKGTQITKGDVKKYMKSLEESEVEESEEAVSAEDILTHDDPKPEPEEEAAADEAEAETEKEAESSKEEVEGDDDSEEVESAAEVEPAGEVVENADDAAVPE